MKSIVCLLLFIFPLSLWSNSFQKEKTAYRKGGIISLNNDTISADIKVVSILDFQKEVNFIDAGGKKKSFKPKMIEGFFLIAENDTMAFESRNDIQIGAFPSKKGNFVYRVSNDICPLYFYLTTKMNNIGVEVAMTEVPHYMVRIDYRSYHYQESNFEECVSIFKDNRMLVKDIQDNKYSFSDFPEIVARYCQSIKK